MSIKIFTLLLFLLLSLENLVGIEMPPEQVQVVKDIRSPLNNGTYSYEIVLTDGTKLKQSGNVGNDAKQAMSSDSDQKPESDPSLVIMGEYTFVDPQGETHSVSYIADKNGFRPKVGKALNSGTIGVASTTARAPKSQDSEDDKPLKTISSSLFSSPERLF